MSDERHPLELIRELAEVCGGQINHVTQLDDGSGFATMTLPLSDDHWLTAEGFNLPPMPLRLGNSDAITFEFQPWQSGGTMRVWTRNQLAEAIRAAGRYAVRCATMNGKELDFDPDALLQNLVVGMIGYFTESGLSGDIGDPERQFDPTNPHYESGWKP